MIKTEAKNKTKGKGWQNLSTKDKDDKLKSLCLLLAKSDQRKHMVARGISGRVETNLRG